MLRIAIAHTTGTAPSIGVLNVGPGPLLVSNVTVNGDFRQTDDCAGAVAANAGCTIQVFFTPTAPGTRSGTMMIFDNTVAGSHSRETATGLAFPAKASRLPRRRRDYPA